MQPANNRLPQAGRPNLEFSIFPPQRSLLTAFCVALFLAANCNGQDASDSEAIAWLPLTLNQTLQDSLATVTTHVSTRRGCGEVLQAKVSENSDQENPKFIITCAGDSGGTLNFVYWQSDIDEGFSGDTYPKKQERQVYSEAEQVRLKLEKLRSDNADLIVNCQLQLQDKMGDREPIFEDEDVSIVQRGEQMPVVYIDYSAGASEYAPTYTATCKRGIQQPAQITIFRRNSR